MLKIRESKFEKFVKFSSSRPQLPTQFRGPRSSPNFRQGDFEALEVRRISDKVISSRLAARESRFVSWNFEFAKLHPRIAQAYKMSRDIRSHELLAVFRLVEEILVDLQNHKKFRPKKLFFGGGAFSVSKRVTEESTFKVQNFNRKYKPIFLITLLFLYCG
jgi:hypothetical protein